MGKVFKVFKALNDEKGELDFVFLIKQAAVRKKKMNEFLSFLIKPAAPRKN